MPTCLGTVCFHLFFYTRALAFSRPVGGSVWYDTETGDIYSYTYRTADIEADDIVVDTSKISVYRTRFVENANGTSWSVAGSAAGYATVVHAPNSSSQLVIEPSSWQTWEN